MDWWSGIAIRAWQTGRVVVVCGLLVLSLAGGAVGGTGSHPSPQAPSPQPTVHTPATGATPQLVDVAASDLPGSGTAEDPYQISNISDLQAMENDLDAHYVLVSDIDATATTQVNDGAGFSPIGPLFSGIFDGQGYTISGLTIDRPKESTIGLFQRIGSSGAVKNVSLRNMIITGSVNVGGVAGFNEATIRNVSVNATVNGSRHVGGLVGQNQGSIRSVSVSGRVTGSDDTGGVAGFNRLVASIQNVSASATVNGSRQAGGLVGVNAGSIRKASASGRVDAVDRVGGLVGSNTGPIQNASASGRVSGSIRVGGLIGQSVSASDITIRDTFATGKVTGDTAVGGLIGVNDETVTDSYWDITATGQNVSAGGATGLTTAEMRGSAAQQNMNGLEFGEAWRTVPDDYPELIALAGSTNSPVPAPMPAPGEEPSMTATVDDAGQPGGTARVTYRLTNLSGQDSIRLNVTSMPAPISLNESASDLGGGTFSDGILMYDDPSETERATIAFDISATAGAKETFTVTAQVEDETGVESDQTQTTIGGESQTVSERFDADGDGIEIGELGAAAIAFAQGDLTIAELGQVAIAFAQTN